jgi:hypothetical protein
MATATGRTFRDISGDFFKFEKPGDAVEGMLISKDVISMKKGTVINDVGKYVVENDEGIRKSFLGGAVLDSTLAEIDLGNYIRVTFTGTRKSSNNMDVKQFKIELAE